MRKLRWFPFVSLILIAAMVLASCSPGPVVPVTTTTGTATQPQPKPERVQTPPPPRSTPRPPISFQEDVANKVKVWNLTSQPVTMDAVFAGSLTLAVADGPEPGPADALALVVLVGGTFWVVATAATAAAQHAAAWNNLFLVAQTKGVVMPKVPEGVKLPPIPEHLARDHDAYTGMAKIAGWLAAWLALENGATPKCGQRPGDNVWVVLLDAADAVITKTTGGVYKGILIVLNPTNRTVEWGVKTETGADGVERFKGTDTRFEVKPCPSLDALKGLATP